MKTLQDQAPHRCGAYHLLKIVGYTHHTVEYDPFIKSQLASCMCNLPRAINLRALCGANLVT